MNKRIAKPLCIFLTLIMLTVSGAAVTVSAEANPYSLSGDCGANGSDAVQYFCFNDNSMAIMPKNNNEPAAMRNYSLDTSNGGYSTAPWYNGDLTKISSTLFATKIAVEYGVTSIGDYSFYLKDYYEYGGFVQLYNVDISSTVEYIGKYAFYNQRIEHVVIPPSVTHIGENAFKNCTLKPANGITYYGNPADLTWDSDSKTADTEFSSKMTVHILNSYASRVAEFNELFAYKNIEFSADMTNPYANEDMVTGRNIALYYGSVNSRVFGGAAPFIIIGSFNGKKKSVTYGSNGFASCVYDDNDKNYYILTNNGTGALNEAVCPQSSGYKVTEYKTPARNDLKLNITHTYIGTNTVKVIYRLTNTTKAEIKGLKMGGTGDIKIGADDTAAINPLNETINNETKQVGFYMKSTKDYDKSNSDDYATLGFIGKDVKDNNNTYYSDANFFYGKVAANSGASAAGSKSTVLIPYRIFNINEAQTDQEGQSHTSGNFNNELDSGMSFYWDIDSLPAESTVERAVLFSVYGANASDNGQAMVTEKEATFHTVTWKDWNDTILMQQLAAENETVPASAYSGAEPSKEEDYDYTYAFNGWNIGETDQNGNVVYTAQYTQTAKLFKGHSLTLNGDIGVNFYLNPTLINVGDKVDFKWFTKSSAKTIKDSDLVTLNINNEQKQFYKVSCNVAAAEMAYNIHAVATINGHVYSETDDYSVREYGDKIISSPNGTFDNQTELTALAERMLDYGAKAQVLFDRIPNNLANGNVTNYSMPTEPPEIPSKKDNMQNGTDELGLKYMGTSVVYLTTTTLRHYYKVVDKDKFAAVKNTSNFNYGAKGSLIYYEYTDIAAADLDEPIEFTIGAGDKAKSYKFSALDYARIVLNNNTTTDEEKALAMASYWYNNAANTYYSLQGV